MISEIVPVEQIHDKKELLFAYVKGLQGGIYKAVDDLEITRKDSCHSSARVLLSIVMTGKFSPKILSAVSGTSLDETREILGRLKKNKIIGNKWLHIEWPNEGGKNFNICFILDALCGSGEIHRLRNFNYVSHENYKPQIGRIGSFGRPRKFSNEQVEIIRKKYRQGYSTRKLSKEFDIHRNTMVAILGGRGVYEDIDCSEPPIESEVLWRRKTGAKFTYSQADEIRKAYSNGESAIEIAKRFEVDDKTIRQIIDNRTYSRL